MTFVKDERRILRSKVNNAPICNAKINNKNSDKNSVPIIAGTTRHNSQKRLTKNIAVEIIMQTAHGGTSTCLSLRAYLSVPSNSMVNFFNPEFPYQSCTFSTRRCLHQHLFHLLFYTKLRNFFLSPRSANCVYRNIHTYICMFYVNEIIASAVLETYELGNPYRTSKPQAEKLFFTS